MSKGGAFAQLKGFPGIGSGAFGKCYVDSNSQVWPQLKSRRGRASVVDLFLNCGCSPHIPIMGLGTQFLQA